MFLSDYKETFTEKGVGVRGLWARPIQNAFRGLPATILPSNTITDQINNTTFNKKRNDTYKYTMKIKSISCSLSTQHCPSGRLHRTPLQHPQADAGGRPNLGNENKLLATARIYITYVIWDPAVLLCYSRTYGGRQHRACAGNQKLQGVELRIVSCFISEIFYRRKRP